MSDQHAVLTSALDRRSRWRRRRHPAHESLRRLGQVVPRDLRVMSVKDLYSPFRAIQRLRSCWPVSRFLHRMLRGTVPDLPDSPSIRQ